MRSRSRAAIGAALIPVLAAAAAGFLAAPADAAPADVHVRVEGVASTVFDRVVRTDGRYVQAAADTTLRHCDGTNLGANPSPGPTATAATVDAMASIGQGFDARWYAGFDDYFLTRWGTEAENDAKQWWWGIVVNRSFTPVGGCQFRVGTGDDVLWVNDAFNGRAFLWLAGPAKALLDAPYDADVSATRPSTEGDDPVGDAYAGARVSAVTANGRPAPAGAADAGDSGSDGRATVAFRQLGWQRIKARALDGDADGRDDAIASNSVDVCVVAALADECAGQPPSRVPLIPPAAPQPPAPPASPAPPAPPVGPAPPTPSARNTAPVRVQLPRVADDARRGRVQVDWRVIDAGAGIARWTIAARPLGVRGAGFTDRASGSDATSASLRLPAGRTYALRFTLVDTLGRSASTNVGRVLAPIDDRARSVARGRAWTAARDAGAWLGTVSRGATGAILRTRLAAGRPVVVVRPDRRRAARAVLIAGGRRTTVRIPAGSGSRELRGPVLRRGGVVTLQVLEGEVSVDGVGLAA
ncbi:hypothetical protein [Conexibacter sp. CPCC 206217]|uniref:hypothetical protein n=1 Tax=Conexibacter sp. CPCC 206217 TaxID=3064574 RepID=UPI00271A7295|nr:hypothetical protein [Conexibacter sp. CPCC 206217]MDO8212201.1 hypothetical protein [Conexibacter sp. CPCC 206217]